MENKNNKKIDGNTHTPHECPFCWRVVYSKGALTTHINKEHWDVKDTIELGHTHNFELLSQLKYRRADGAHTMVKNYGCICGAGKISRGKFIK